MYGCRFNKNDFRLRTDGRKEVESLIYVIAGLASGVISGMGIGGGVILIPALTIFLSFEQHAAQAVNLIYFIPTAVVALVTHIKNKKIQARILPRIIAAGVIGAVAGSLLASALEGGLLRKLFGGFLLLMAIHEFFKKDSNEQGQNQKENNAKEAKRDYEKRRV